MKTARLKNIVIVILVLFNAFLLLLLSAQHMQQRSARNRAANQLQQLFEASGISLHTDILPEQTSPVEHSIFSDAAKQKEFASSLLGDAVQSQNGNASRYENEFGFCQFRSNGSVEASFTDCAVESPIEFCEKLFRAYSYTILPSDRAEAEATVKSGSGKITGTFCVNDSAVYNAQLSLHFEKGKLTELSGTFLSSVSDGETISGISAMTALVNFLDYYNTGGRVCTEVTDLQGGYLLQGFASAQLKLAPIWYIATDVSSYYVDCVTGVVSRA